MKRILSFLLLICISYGMTATAQEQTATAQEEMAEDSLLMVEDKCPTDIYDHCALLAARGDVTTLEPLYDSLRTELPEHVDLYCRFAFAHAAGNDAEVISTIDTLESKYADHLDIRGLLAVSEMKCGALLRTGDYSRLKQYCKSQLDLFYRRSVKASRQQYLKNFQELAIKLMEKPGVNVVWNEDEFIIPSTRDWPILIPASIGDNEKAPFLYEPSQRWTFISSNDAKEWGVKPENVRMTVRGSQGSMKASPAFIDTLRIGELAICNTVVFVVDSTVAAPYNRSIGMVNMARMNKVTIHNDYFKMSRKGSPGIKDMSARTAENYQPYKLKKYLAGHSYFALLRNEPSLLFTVTDEEREEMEEVLEMACTPPAKEKLPTWLIRHIDAEIIEGATPHFLLNTPEGLAYEVFNGERYRTVVLTEKKIKDCSVDLQNMIIYVP